MDDLVIDEYDPLLIAFSSHQQFPCLKVNICQADADTLTDTQAGICKDHRNRIVSLSGIHKYLLEKRLHIFLFYFRRACNFLLEFQPVLYRDDQIFLNSKEESFVSMLLNFNFLMFCRYERKSKMLVW